MISDVVFNKDFEAATIFVMKTFEADVSTVWKYYTQEELLDQWWAPEPWKCQTEKMDFREGGNWIYAMVSPENEKHYSKVTFQEITFHRSISQRCNFADENGTEKSDSPAENWLIGFTGVQEGTKLTMNLHFASSEEMKKMLEMGFEEGLKLALSQLDEILNKKD